MTRSWFPLLSALVLVGLTASAAPAALAPPASPLAFNSGNFSELVTSLPVAKAGTPDLKRVVYCVDVGAVPAPGSIISASAELEVTNDLEVYQPLVAGQIILADSCTATTGTDITEANGENCTPLQHHCVSVRSGLLVVGVTTRHHVSLVMHSAHTRAQPGDAVKVEQDFGRLAVLVWPAV